MLKKLDFDCRVSSVLERNSEAFGLPSSFSESSASLLLIALSSASAMPEFETSSQDAEAMVIDKFEFQARNASVLLFLQFWSYQVSNSKEKIHLFPLT